MRIAELGKMKRQDVTRRKRSAERFGRARGNERNRLIHTYLYSFFFITNVPVFSDDVHNKL